MDGESDAEAIARELREELGVGGRPMAAMPLLEIRDPGSPFLIAFIPTTLEGEATPLEHTELRWVSVDAMQYLPLAPTDSRFASALRARIADQ